MWFFFFLWDYLDLSFSCIFFFLLKQTNHSSNETTFQQKIWQKFTFLMVLFSFFSVHILPPDGWVSIFTAFEQCFAPIFQTLFFFFNSGIISTSCWYFLLLVAVYLVVCWSKLINIWYEEWTKINNSICNKLDKKYNIVINNNEFPFSSF